MICNTHWAYISTKTDYIELFQSMQLYSCSGRNSSSDSYLYTTRDSRYPFFLVAHNGNMSLFYTTGSSNNQRQAIFTMSDSYAWVGYYTHSNYGTQWFLGHKNGWNTLYGGTILLCNFSNDNSILKLNDFFSEYSVVRSSGRNLPTSDSVSINVADAKDGDFLFAFWDNHVAISVYQEGSWVVLQSINVPSSYPNGFVLKNSTAYLGKYEESYYNGSLVYGGTMILMRRK